MKKGKVFENKKSETENWSESKIKRRTFFSFAGYLLAGGAGIAGWKWYRSLPQDVEGLAQPTRKVLGFNEKVNDTFFGKQHLAPTYPKSKAANPPRTNGDVGVDKPIDLEKWQLEVVNPMNKTSFFVKMDDIKTLPKEDIVFDFKCIEGWDEIVHYGGTKFSNFLKKYNLGTKNAAGDWYKYVGLETPDGEYFVGLDMKSVMHPQTLLCYEMNGEELPEDHGAPLRLIIPVKYGVKNMKRIGKMFFSDTPPRDYWHEEGYEYDAAL